MPRRSVRRPADRTCASCRSRPPSSRANWPCTACARATRKSAPRCINRIRGLLAEFGLVFAQSPEALRAVLADVLEDASNELPGVARLALQRAHLHWIDLDAADCAGATSASPCTCAATSGRRKAAACRASARSPPRRWWPAWATSGSSRNAAAVRRLARPGAQPELHRRQGQPGRHHQARRRLPAHAADPGREVRSDDGRANAADRISQWLVQLKERVGWQKAVVALANKNARILWAVLTRDGAFDPEPCARAACGARAAATARITWPA